MTEYKISANLTADVSKFKRAIESAKRAAQSFKREAEGDDPEIDADISPLKRAVREAKRAISSIKNDKAEAKVDLDDGAINSKIRYIKAMLRSIPNRVRTRVDVDYDRNVFSRISAGWRQVQDANNKFGDDMDQLANSIRAFGTVSANMIKGSLISSFTALIPIVAALVPAIMAVGNAIAVVGGGAIGLVGSFGILQAGAYAFGFMAASAIKMLNDGMLEATKATENYKSALDEVKSTWEDIVKQNAAQIFNAMANGMKAATSALKQLQPFFSGVAKSVEGASQKMLTWVKSSDIARNAFNMLNTTGVKVFGNMLSGAGRVGAGITSIFTQFGPLFAWVSSGFRNMATDFLAWSTSIETANGIKNFINYTKENLPLIGKIFGDTFMGLFNLFRAFSTNSQTIFESLAQMTAKFREWSETVGQSDGFKKFVDYVQTNGPTIMSLIGAITMAVVNFGIAVAPIGQKVLEVATAFAQWLSTMFQTHPIVAQIVAVLITLLGIGMQLAPVIDFLRITFTMIIAPLMRMVGVGTLAANSMKLLGVAFTFLTGPVGIAITAIAALVAGLIYLWNTNDTFRNAFIAGWEMTKVAFVAAIEMIKQSLITGFTTMVAVGLQIFTGLQTGLAAIWTAVSTVFTTSVNLIRTVVSSGFSTVLNFITSTMSAISSFIYSTWSSILSAVSSFISSIVSNVSSGFSNMLSIASSIMSSILSAITSAWSTIVSVISSSISNAVSVVVSGFSSMISAVISFASQLVSQITSAMSSFVSAIVSGGSQAVSAITSACSQMVSAASGFIGDMMSVGANLISGMIDGIMSMANDLVGAAKGVVGDAISAAKSLLKIHSPSRVFRDIGEYTMMGMTVGINSEGRSTIGATADMARKVTSAFNPQLATPQFNGIEGALNSAQSQLNTQLQSNVNVDANPQTIIVKVEGNAEWLRAHVNEQNALDESLAF